MKVFIIDDDHLSLFLTENLLLLEDKTLAVSTFLSATAALEALRADGNFPNLIFLDLNMPVMDGWGFLDSLIPFESALKDSCDLYILTSSLDLEDSARAKEYPIVKRLIHKPLEKWDIKSILALRGSI